MDDPDMAGHGVPCAYFGTYIDRLRHGAERGGGAQLHRTHAVLRSILPQTLKTIK